MTGVKVYFDKAGLGSAADWRTSFQDQYDHTIGRGYMSLPTGSHDEPRIANESRDPKELKVLLTFLLTQPGVPLIYYGVEIGMKYISGSPDVEGSKARSGTRTPMQWDSSENAGFSTASKDKVYIPLDSDPKRPTVSQENKDPGPQLNYVRELLKLRQSAAAMGNDGGFEFIPQVGDSFSLIYRRQKDGEKYIVAINPSGRGISTKIAGQVAARVTYVVGTGKKCTYKSGKSEDTLTLPPESAAVFKLE